MEPMEIGEVAKRAGVRVSALRYYEERGLIASTGRRGLRRLFDAGVLERLALIALGRAAGFSLDEIARMFAPGGEPRLDRGMLAARAEELDRKIQRMIAMRDGLRHAAACGAPTHMECPTFRRLLQEAGHGRVPALEERGSGRPLTRGTVDELKPRRGGATRPRTDRGLGRTE
jgi:DNA-binding transcriptional MerR regulator